MSLSEKISLLLSLQIAFTTTAKVVVNQFELPSPISLVVCGHFPLKPFFISLLAAANSSAGGSGQAATYAAAANSIASLSLRFVASSYCGLTLVGCGMYCYRRLISDIGFHNGVTNVPVEKISEMAKAEN
ncbi:hypothetical protein MTR_3g063980 [Medicago truncatula]|uniref:Transmembrane protein n=1 Tax=Medicago truncatula TaxID=3880 RepID=G7J781_MEDTR|nr:hypothetical protein MTR_3g063980 [Medicago truncatula]